MKLLSLFDGEGGFPLAAVMNGIEPVAASEIEPYPIAITRSKFPRMKHLGDIAFVNGADIEPVDIATFGSPCFPAGTLVLTERGYREIEQLSVGERVLTHTGRWMPITDIGFKFDKTIVLHGNHMGLECTKNHPIYSANRVKVYPRKEDGKRTNAFKLTDKFDWIPAEDMVGKLWGVPRSFESIDIPINSASSLREKEMPELNVDTFYLIGRWIGDGWVRDGQRSNRPEGQHSGTIIICAGKKREDSLRSAVERVFDKYHIEQCRTANKYIFTSRLFSEWIVDNFGKYAHGKFIPSWAFGMRSELREALLRGILESDGHEYSEGNYKVTSVSRKLVEGIRLLSETLGFSTTTCFTERPKTTAIEGRTVNQRDTYTLVITKSKVRKTLKSNLHSWYLVRRIDPQDTVKRVYNISVERDNSYVVNGIVVHNCQSMSVAGKREGLKHESQGDDETTRSGMFFEAIRIITEMREATNGQYPRFAVWENVPGAFSSGGGRDFLAVLQAIAAIAEPAVSIPEPERDSKTDNLIWFSAGSIVGNGWSIAWRTLDAQYWGVPQRRKRIYLVADFGSERAADLLLERYSLRGNIAESGEARKTVTEDATGCVDGGLGIECLNPWDSQSERVYSDSGVHPSVNANSGGGQDRHAVVYSFDSLSSNSMKSANPNSGCREVDVAKCIDTTFPDPSKNQGGIAIVQPVQEKTLVFNETQITSKKNGNNPQWNDPCHTLAATDRPPTVIAFAQNQRDEVRDLNGVSGSVAAEAGTHQQTFIAQSVIALQANGIDRADNAGCNGAGWREDQSYTLNTVDRHAVCYPDVCGTLAASGAGSSRTAGQGNETDFCIVSKSESNRRFIVRRLMPIETTRLQGYPDTWHELAPFDGDVAFWESVRKTWAEVNGKQYRPFKTIEQLEKWYNGLRTDAAEYKADGNSLAIPCAEYVIRRIAETVLEESNQNIAKQQ